MKQNAQYVKTYLSLGSNLGDRIGHLRVAVESLKACGRLLVSSIVIESAAWGYSDPNPYLNMCCRLDTKLPPETLREKLVSIEQDAGRSRAEITEGYAARTLDIDILLYGDEIIQTSTLEIPHPRMVLRRFVLHPLAELAPDLVHPILKKTIRVLLKETTDQSIITLYPIEL